MKLKNGTESWRCHPRLVIPSNHNNQYRPLTMCRLRRTFRDSPINAPAESIDKGNTRQIHFTLRTTKRGLVNFKSGMSLSLMGLSSRSRWLASKTEIGHKATRNKSLNI